MTDYRGMYTRLFNRISDAVALLQSAQAETEEVFIDQDDPEVLLLDNSDSDD